MPTELTPPYWTGGPPYPQFATDEGKFGLSVLDWFAGHALAGLMASELIDREFFDQFTFPAGQLPLATKNKAKSEVVPAAPQMPPTPDQLAMIAYGGWSHG